MLSTVKKYRKKPVVVTAILFTGSNYVECKAFVDGHYNNALNYPNVETREGCMRVSEGDYIIKGTVGEFYPCKPDAFADTYEKTGKLLDTRIEDFNTSSDLHLCDSCCLGLPTCPGKVIVWGDGKGNDNVVACLSYEPLKFRGDV